MTRGSAEVFEFVFFSFEKLMSCCTSHDYSKFMSEHTHHRGSLLVLQRLDTIPGLLPVHRL